MKIKKTEYYPRVLVLLSTYNGEKFLRTQLDSLLKQTGVKLSVLIRDDGSSDKTSEILREYMDYKNIEIMVEDNLGVIKSFFNLIEKSNDDFEYYAFCDQDDYWSENKLERAINKINKLEVDRIPILYSSALSLVDEDLNEIGYNRYKKIFPDFNNALVENIVTGCTAVFNREAMLLIKNKIPSFTLMHDWWLYLVVSAFGTVIYDNESYIKYRQHSSNVVGMNHNFVDEASRRIKQFVNRKDKFLLVTQAQEFNKLYGSELSESKAKILSRFINRNHSLGSSIQYALSHDVYRQRFYDNFILSIMLLFRQM